MDQRPLFFPPTTIVSHHCALVKNQAQDARHKNTDYVAFWVLSGIWGSLGFCNSVYLAMAIWYPLVSAIGSGIDSALCVDLDWFSSLEGRLQGIKDHPKWSVEPGENGKIFGDFSPLFTRYGNVTTCSVKIVFLATSEEHEEQARIYTRFRRQEEASQYSTKNTCYMHG
ncbi:hypothetical protein DFH08DRAFT_800931 [Mycena albidolilacea]|uniref:Uncharacterized protein n=1 Tax=Mycena albidolilacea TaxID=1033008 RepID=A0AAD7AL70_9AGAR|nr:hypothetical protein DFH08DRAFT_800931 [Mycena albidolilacea]